MVNSSGVQTFGQASPVHDLAIRCLVPSPQVPRSAVRLATHVFGVGLTSQVELDTFREGRRGGKQEVPILFTGLGLIGVMLR